MNNPTNGKRGQVSRMAVMETSVNRKTKSEEILRVQGRTNESMAGEGNRIACRHMGQ